MDREKIIKQIEKCINDASCIGCPYEKSLVCRHYMLADALALLKEQAAVEPKKESDGNPEMWASWWYVCGNCGEAIDLHDMYCRHCGRAVKWE